MLTLINSTDSWLIAGFELYTDMIYADFLLSHTPFFDEVVFHPKTIPWFVSDVLPVDFRYALSFSPFRYGFPLSTPHLAIHSRITFLRNLPDPTHCCLFLPSSLSSCLPSFLTLPVHSSSFSKLDHLHPPLPLLLFPFPLRLGRLLPPLPRSSLPSPRRLRQVQALHRPPPRRSRRVWHRRLLDERVRVPEDGREGAGRGGGDAEEVGGERIGCVQRGSQLPEAYV
jgi:hypothetical protein